MSFWQRLLAFFGLYKPPAPAQPAPELPPAQVYPTAISAAGLKLVEHFEGCYLTAYQDSVGVWTIGWGRIQYDDGTPVQQGDSCSQAKADEWLAKDVETDGSQFVRKWATANGKALTQQQFDALASFTYNRGAGRFHQLCGMAGEMANNLLTFDYAGSPPKQLPGLTRRRWAERAMYLGQDWTVFMGSDWQKFAHL